MFISFNPHSTLWRKYCYNPILHMKYQKHRGLSNLSGVTQFIRDITGLYHQTLWWQIMRSAPHCHSTLHRGLLPGPQSAVSPFGHSPPIKASQDLSKHSSTNCQIEVWMSFMAPPVPSPCALRAKPFPLGSSQEHRTSVSVAILQSWSGGKG